MVVPFMSIYLTSQIKLDIASVGWIMACYGAGSMTGAWLGGKLTDKWGHYSVQIWSLGLGGLGFIMLSFFKDFYSIAAGVFLAALLADAYRPANAASIAQYSTPENRTRAYALNRLAINLGYSVGPALGGLLATISYDFLFWADGFTCILAASLLFILLKRENKKQSEKSQIAERNTDHTTILPPQKDKIYLLFIFFTHLFAVSFFQLFTTVPLYCRYVYQLEESYIGLLIGLNGFIVVLVEMILVYQIEGKKSPLQFVTWGVGLVAISYILLILGGNAHIAFVVFFMIVISFGEILSMPFMNVFVIERSSAETRGQYMAMYTMAYSLAHIVAPVAGAQLITNVGFSGLWIAATLLSLLTMLAFRYLAQIPLTKNLSPIP